MKSKIINTAILIWIIALTCLAGYTVYTNYKLSIARNQSFTSINSNIANIDVNLQIEKGEEQIIIGEIINKENVNTLLIFSSIGCEACDEQLSYLEEAKRQNKLKLDPKLIVIENNFQNSKNNDIFLDYFTITNKNYMTYFDNSPTPLTLVVDSKGNVLYSHTGWSRGKNSIKMFVDKINSF